MQDPLLAASGTLGSIVPVNLFGGESLVTTTPGVFAAGQSLARYTVVARATNGKIVAWDPASADVGTKSAVGVSALLIDTLTVNADVEAPYYDGGTFNHLALVWPVAVTTLVARKAAFDRTPITIEKIL